MNIFSGRIKLENSSIDYANIEIVKYDSYIEIRLVDCNSVFNYFICSISSSDFLVLKKNQDIFVDFEKFLKIITGLFYNVSMCSMTQSGGFQDKTVGNERTEDRIKNAFEEQYRIENGFGNRYNGREDSEVKMNSGREDFTGKHEGMMNFIYAEFSNNVLRFIENSEFRKITKLELSFTRATEKEFSIFFRDFVKRLENDNKNLLLENRNIRSNAEMRIKTAQRRFEEYRQMVEGYQKKERTLNEEMKKLELEFQMKTKENEELVNKVFNLENTNKLLDTYKKQSEDLNRKLDDIKRYCDDLERQNTMLKERLVNYERVLEENKQLNTKTKENEIYANENNRLRHSKKELERKYAELEKKLKEKRIEIEKLGKTSRDLQRKLDNAQSVYSHFYTRKFEDVEDSDFSVGPEKF